MKFSAARLEEGGHLYFSSSGGKKALENRNGRYISMSREERFLLPSFFIEGGCLTPLYQESFEGGGNRV